MSVVEKITSTNIKLAYWYVMGRHQSGDLPCRANLDPIEMKDWLTNIELLDVINQGETFRYRIAGGAIEEIFNCRMQGKLLEDVFQGAVLDFKLLMFRRCVDKGTIILSNDNLEREGQSLVKYERLLIPLSRDGVNFDMIFGCIYPLEKRDKPIGMSDPALSIISEQLVEDALLKFVPS